MASIRCCHQEQVFQHRETGETICLAHSHTRSCEVCGHPVERCSLIGCGTWVCRNPLLDLMLQHDYIHPSPWIH